MNKPFAAYRGPESYIFVCYAHADAEAVYGDLEHLHKSDIRLWYDEGIPAGAAWRGEIAGAIKGAHKLLLFISESSLNSKHCLRELDYALDHDIKIIPIYLEPCALPAELELSLNRVQALFRDRDPRYRQNLLAVLRGQAGVKRFIPRNKTIPFRLAFSFGLLLLASAAIAYLTVKDSPELSAASTASGVITSEVISPNAFDHYLNGMNLVQRWDQGDNLAAAISEFREATTMDPDFALAYARLGDAQRMHYALSGDEESLQAAIGNVQQATRLNASLAPVQVALGRIHSAQGNFDLAYAAIERAIAIDPNDAAANQTLASVYERQGRMDDAETAFRKAVSLDPDDLTIRDSHANFLFRRGRYDDAIEQWQRVIDIAPDHYAAYVNLGSALSQTARIAEAITMYEKAIEIRPTYMAYSNLGTAYGWNEQYPAAVEAYQRALEFEEADWLAWGNLGYIYSWMGASESRVAEAFERAIQLADAARQQNSRDPFIFSDLALYAAKTGRREMALQHIATALSLSADSSEIQAAAAEAFELMGERNKALSHIELAIELGYPTQLFQQNPDLKDLFSETSESVIF